MGPLNPGCFDCFPLACPVLASFSISFSSYVFPFQIFCLNVTRFLPNWHKFFWLIAAIYRYMFQKQKYSSTARAGGRNFKNRKFIKKIDYLELWIIKKKII